MGCLFSKGGAAKEEETPKVFSWDRKDRPDPKDYTLEDLRGETVGRVPGTVNGQQFVIKNCENCKIYIFDHAATITVDKCHDCIIFLGPIKGSVFFRNCSNIKCAVACQQFRTRDCKHLDVFLHCGSQPIIESSTKMRFGCFQYAYPELADQFAQSSLNPYRNNWDNIHDFSPMPDEQNWRQIPEDVSIEDVVPPPTTEKFQDVRISMSADDSVVPLTIGGKRYKGTESSLVVFFRGPSSSADQTLREFLRDMRRDGSCGLVRTTEIHIDAGTAARLFGPDDRFAVAAIKGPAVGLEFNGTDTSPKCLAVARPFVNHAVVFVPRDKETGSKALEDWNSLVESQMAM